MKKFEQAETLVCKVTFVSTVEADSRDAAETLFNEGAGELVAQHIGDALDSFGILECTITECGQR